VTVTLQEQRATVIKEAEAVVSAAKAADRALTADESEQVTKALADVEGIDAKIKSGTLVDKVLALGTGKAEDDDAADSLGAHFMKHAGAKLADIRGIKNASVAAPEFIPSKASVTTGGTAGVFGNILTEFDRTIVRGYREQPVVADLLASGTIAGQAIQYFVEGAVTGQPGMVAEGAAKPEFTVALPTTVTDSLRKIAGWFTTTDEMTEDLPFMVSEINNRLLYRLAMVEEQQLLNGAGTGQNLQGVLLRSGIQTETQAVAPDTGPEALFRAMTKIQTATGFAADGLVIHPSDYQSIRLSKDANGQYFGGGFFTGPYGQGGIMQNPPIWGLRTVVSTAVAAKTAVVGAWRQGGTVYRKGGVRVESTNTHSDNFTSNLVTVRAEERIGLAVRVPAAFVKVTLL